MTDKPRVKGKTVAYRWVIEDGRGNETEIGSPAAMEDRAWNIPPPPTSPPITRTPSPKRRILPSINTIMNEAPPNDVKLRPLRLPPDASGEPGAKDDQEDPKSCQG